MCAIYAFCRRADDIADSDWQDRFPGSKGEMDPEAVAYREELESLQNKDTILQEELYLEKITQLFFLQKETLHMLFYNWQPEPHVLALKDTIGSILSKKRI